MKVPNPLLPGCYPDPSICRAGDWYYLVTSTFEMWPGLPIFRSRDLAHWEQIGHVIDRPEQMTFHGVQSSHGLFAPTIRHHNGTFYVVCTRVGQPEAPHQGNFLVTAQDPAGDWSEPIWLADRSGSAVAGIDPSIFFASDGRIWLHGTRPARSPEWDSQTEVWLREYDPDRGVVIGEEYVIWTGAVRGAVWAEGPHLFEHEGRFYLLAAEGGTEIHHAVCIARSSSVTGPYEGNKANPVLTHRHLGHPGCGTGPDVVGVGHADLVQAQDGSWWAVLLGMRPYGGYHYNLGRETFLLPVQWQHGWPVFAPGEGRVPAEVDIPFANDDAAPRTSPQHVIGGIVPPEDYRWSSLRGPWDSFAEPQGSGWRIAVQPATLAERTTPSFLGVRQQHQNLDLRAELDLTGLAPGEEGGVVLRQSEEHHASLSLLRREQDWWVRAVLHQGQEETVLSEHSLAPAALEASAAVLGVQVRGQDYTFTLSGADFAIADGRQLDTVTTGGFLGLWLGIFATSNGRPTSSTLTLRRFDYTPLI